ncbi:MAG TPA: hypothetical protein VF040_16860 [Ktedonobacterales bacterium]
MRKVLIICAPVLLIALLAGCGQSTAVTNDPVRSLQPTATVQATETPTPGTLGAGHQCDSRGYGYNNPVTMGDLHITRVVFEFSWPLYELPATLDASKPYQLPDNIPDHTGTTGPVPPVNPTTTETFGYALDICNTSTTASHVINGVSVSIAAFSAYSGQLNSWNPCGAWYQRPGGVTGGGCGGGSVEGEGLHATFAADATTGARAAAAQVSTGTEANGGHVPPLPLQLGPGQRIRINVGLTPPTTPGTYTFAFALSYDTVTDAPISAMPPTLFDSATVTWNGQNCTRAAMVSQIPSDDTQSRYVCAP